MPNQNPVAINCLGQPIYEIDPTERLRNLWLRDLEFPRDERVIRHLSAQDFRNWLYGLHPVKALTYSCYSKEFAKIQRRKQLWLTRIFDMLWRWKHGLG